MDWNQFGVKDSNGQSHWVSVENRAYGQVSVSCDCDSWRWGDGGCDHWLQVFLGSAEDFDTFISKSAECRVWISDSNRDEFLRTLEEVRSWISGSEFEQVLNKIKELKEEYSRLERTLSETLERGVSLVK